MLRTVSQPSAKTRTTWGTTNAMKRHISQKCQTRARSNPVAPQHAFARRRAIPLTEVAAEPLIGLTREDYPNYYDLLSTIFSKVKQKLRVIEEHDSMSGVMSAVEAGTGVAVAVDFGYSFGNRVRFLHLTPEPKPFSVGIVATKGRLSPAAEKFWQCAKEAASKN